MMNGMGWGMGWGMGFGWIFWLVIIGLIIWAIKAFSQNQRSQNQPGPPTESALDILKKRYARGEISFEEYEEKRKHLTQ
ncbi:MAG: SHOCT domain-containing protein [Calditrichaeota bacterium]|nr:MAG: SHOCT domain-containing protein [Calditrichota bacterium]